jgi:hypothetical protein
MKAMDELDMRRWFGEKIPPGGMNPGGPHIATEFDSQPTRARGVLRYVGRLLWEHPPQILLDDPDGPWLWRFDHATGRYQITNRRSRGEART